MTLLNRTLRNSIVPMLFASTGLCQFESASLRGTVTDRSGALLAGVSVTAANEGTDAIDRAVTGQHGLYLFPSIRPGRYYVSARAEGFKELVIMQLSLQVNQAARLDLVLDVGSVKESVYVAATQPLLETESSSRGAVIDQRRIAELPLNGRDYNQLALLSPGVLPGTPRLLGIGFRGAFNVNGNRVVQNAFQLDGVDNTSYSNSFRGNNMQVIQPSVEALQEFKIQTNAYSAEFGRSAGALINAISRSGSNALHGSVYEFHRNDNFDAATFFSNRNRLAKPVRLRNQFGGAAGGRIVRNQTFFFADYEGLRSREGTVRTSSVPQTVWKQGLFTIPIYNPYNPNDTGADFRIEATPLCNDGRGNCWQIRRSLIDPVGQRVIDVSPAPNAGAPGQLDNNFVFAPADRNRTDQFDIRIDHNLPRLATLFGRYSFADTDYFRPSFRPGLSEGSNNDTFGTADLRSQALVTGITWILAPRLLSETRVGWMQGDFQQLPVNQGSGCPEQLIGLKGSLSDESICGGLPVFNFNGVLSRRIGRTTSQPQFQTPHGRNVRQSFARIAQVHTLKFGGEFVQASTGIRDISALLGNFDFTGRFSGQNGQYQGAVADLLLGFPTRYQQDSNTVFQLYQNMYFAYLQDDWKAAKRITLNLGLRYEFATPPRERDWKWTNFDPRAGRFVEAKSGSLFEEALLW
ncbi:MAG TPA: carboxypeptidase regulatory-like domain-containing protein, partial [Bryobacteraceae bacterium]|nr:carboxypeptidase regulatory-like domain-containing protein [Bryobacteraceae bacterium]